MRKILFSIILVLMIIFTGYTVVRGIQIKNIDIWGIERIQIEDETINSANAELSDLASSKYTSSLKNLNNSAETMQKTKSEYESKALLLSDADRHMQTEQYEIEFLWTRIGNFAKDNDVDIKIEVTARDRKSVV